MDIKCFHPSSATISLVKADQTISTQKSQEALVKLKQSLLDPPTLGHSNYKLHLFIFAHEKKKKRTLIVLTQ